ncbi:ORF6N domain-containing protein [Amedibacillus sp. YH-ame10]
MNEIITKGKEFKDLVHIIRGQQVMLDSDLAQLYGTEVSKLNQQVKRNIEKFPNDFMFQLTKEEQDNLKSQNVTSSSHGGKRKLSFVFTEQGVYMIATILKNDIATQQSIYIMRSFKEMKHYLVENKQLLDNTDFLKLTTTVMQNKEDIQIMKDTMATKSDIDKIMENFIDDTPVKEITFLEGQRFEANEAYISKKM